MDKTKSYEISKYDLVEAFKSVKANRGSAGVDGITIDKFEGELKNNLYKIWNRMSSGTYFPPPVKIVEIPKKNGGVRKLGIPTVSDRVAQMAVVINFMPNVERIFHKDSYGYRPNKSAIDAIKITRERCWKYNWVLEFDIKGLFDNIDHELLMKAVEKHTTEKWIILYIERWLKAPFQSEDGTLEERTKGTPQGGVVSPVLANLFLHYAFDKWMEINYPQMPFCRYADDGIAHCKTRKEAENLLAELTKRFAECKLELNLDKTRIVYCKDDDRKENHKEITFDFLGYEFRPRRSKSRYGKHFINFTPAISKKSAKAIRQKVRRWELQLKSDKEIVDLSRMFNPVIRGWINYYGNFYKSAMYPTLRHLNNALICWVRRKYKKLKSYKKAERWLGKVARNKPEYFAHWKMGILPSIE